MILFYIEYQNDMDDIEKNEKKQSNKNAKY